MLGLLISTAFLFRSTSLRLKLNMSGSVERGSIIGNGRIGNMIFEENSRQDVLISRGDNIADKLAPSGPIYVTARNKDLDDIIASTPVCRQTDLVFLQNGILTEYLSKQGLQDNTQALLYVAVAKKGEEPTDGPEGYTSVTGKWGSDFKERMNKAGMFCQVLDKEPWVIKMLEKHTWICAFMAVGSKHGVTVGEVESAHSDEVKALIDELAKAAEIATNITFPPGLQDRLCTYARTVAHFPTALKEFEWRNGWFLDLTFGAIASGKPDPCPLHTDALLQSKDVSVLDAYNTWNAANSSRDKAGKLSMWIVLNSKKYLMSK